MELNKLAVFAYISFVFLTMLGIYYLMKAKPDWFFKEEKSDFSKNFDIKAD